VGLHEFEIVMFVNQEEDLTYQRP